MTNKFRMKCFICQSREGHLARNCKYPPACHNCGSQSHRKFECRSLPHKVPFEIWRIIAVYLGFSNLFELRKVCTYFNEVVLDVVSQLSDRQCCKMFPDRVTGKVTLRLIKQSINYDQLPSNLFFRTAFKLDISRRIRLYGIGQDCCTLEYFRRTRVSVKLQHHLRNGGTYNAYQRIVQYEWNLLTTFEKEVICVQSKLERAIADTHKRSFDLSCPPARIFYKSLNGVGPTSWCTRHLRYPTRNTRGM